MGNRDKRPTSNNFFICTYQGLSNEDYAQGYAGSPLSFIDRNYGEMENTQNLEELACIDGDLKQKSNKRREEVECNNGNQKQKSQKRNRHQKKVKRTTKRKKAHMQDSATVASCAILMPSSNALQVVVVMLLISCCVYQMKNMNVSNFILSLHL